MNPKPIISLLLLFFCCIFSTIAQQLDSRHHAPRSGDQLTLHNIIFSDTVASGYGREWDLSGIEELGKTKMSIKGAGSSADTLTCVVGRTRYYYIIAGDTLKYEGFENNRSDMFASEAETSLIFPLSYQSAFAGTLSGSGNYSDMNRQKMTTDYVTVADAVGRLITMDGDTLTNVMRVRSSRDISVRYIPFDNPVGAPADNILLRETESRIYAAGYRYPVVIAKDLRNAANNSLIAGHAYAIFTAEMEELDDPDNMELREFLALKELETKKNTTPETADPLINYSLRQDRSTGIMAIDFSVADNATINFILSDIYGIVYGTQTISASPGEQYTVSFDYGKLPYAAAYGINISLANEVYSEKFFR